MSSAQRLLGAGFLALVAVWLRLFWGASGSRGPRIRDQVARVAGFDSVFLRYGVLPWLLVGALLISGAVALTASRSGRRTAALIVGSAVSIHLALFGGYAWYHSGSFNGTSGLNSVVDPPVNSLWVGLLSLAVGLCALLLGIGEQRLRHPLRQGERAIIALLIVYAIPAAALSAIGSLAVLYVYVLFPGAWLISLLVVNRFALEPANAVRLLVALGPITWSAVVVERPLEGAIWLLVFSPVLIVATVNRRDSRSGPS